MHQQEQHTSLQNGKITFFHNDIYNGPVFSLYQEAYHKHTQTKLYINFGPHKHHANQQATTQSL